MNRKVFVALGAAAVAVVIENWVYLRSPAPEGDVASEPADASLEAEAADSNGLGSVGEAALRDYLAALPDPERARSPFLTRAEFDALVAAGVGGAGDLDRPVLEGTLTSAARRVAWIDGSAVSEGDLVRGFALLRIEPSFVLLSDGAEALRIDVRAPSSDAAPALDAALPPELEEDES